MNIDVRCEIIITAISNTDNRLHSLHLDLCVDLSGSEWLRSKFLTALIFSLLNLLLFYGSKTFILEYIFGQFYISIFNAHSYNL